MSSLSPTKEALERVPATVAQAYCIVPLHLDGETLVVAIKDPQALHVVDELRLVLKMNVVPIGADAGAIADAIRDFYGVGADTLERLSSGRSAESNAPISSESLDEQTDDASIIRFVNEIIVDGYRNRATDIHLEPFENRLRVRYRIDGVLCDANIPLSIRHFRDAITTRVKIMANLDISERRLPQDGRIRVRIASQEFDLRVSVVPISHGESVNIRILQSSNVFLGLEKIGFETDALEKFEQLIYRPHGIILLTGPTGSGKTTTLYACLGKLNGTDRKIITIEDPVEYQIEGLCQMNVRPDIGLSFSHGLRAVLRHDPDVLLVGEIRDIETAELAIRCALTGHLVFSTLHTNDAGSTAPRLIDIGVQPYLLASSLIAAIAQRLVRTVCQKCALAYAPEQKLIAAFGSVATTAAPAAFSRGAGCDACHHLGFHGRTTIYEFMPMSERIRTLIMNQAHAMAIQRAGIEEGMQTLRGCGWLKACKGETTLEEVLRITQDVA